MAPHSPDSPWSGWTNAAIYDDFVREHGIYAALNRRLVELARIGAARRVLDLACGTGATALACLERLPATGELVGVDGSAAMVQVARARVADPRARFLVAAAAEVARVASGPFDRAVSNAAFWQFPSPAAVLAALARLLAPGALFVFNLPAERLSDEPSGAHPFQVALRRAVAEVTGTAPDAAPDLDPAHLAEALGEAGFVLEHRERFVYPARQHELMELMEIPAMIARAAPGAPAAARATALAQARRHTDPAQAVEVPWVYLVARRVG
ncbi:MAG TPA: methyltransferase domain-containing protein [Thermoanaerobaculia bacterium]|nr:methyltransferase domain-containing protein [Thermoanaerobaculia bacterium]